MEQRKLEVEVTANTAKFEKGMEAVKSKSQESGAAVDKLGKSFKETASAVTVGQAAYDALKSSYHAISNSIQGAVISAGDFQASLTQLVTGAGESESNIELVGKGMKEIAISTGTTLEQLGKGMYMIESAGFHGAEGLNVLKAAAEGAKADGADLNVVADALTTILHNYKLPASDAVSVTNEMVTAVAAGKMHMQDFASSLSTVLPAANDVGLSFAQIAGAEATLTAGGVSANQATQDLNAVIRALEKPTLQQTNAMMQMGLSSLDLSKNLGAKGLTGTLAQISDAIIKHMGPDGLVLQGTLQDATLASKDAQTEIAAMPPKLQDLAKSFLDGTITSKDWHKSLQALTPTQAAMMTQFAVTADKANSFNKELRNGTEASKTFYSELSSLLGQTNAANAAFMLTGKNAGTFNDNVKAIADSANNAGSDVKHWSLIQGTFNQQLAEFKEKIQVISVDIGTKFLPVIAQIMPLLNLVKMLVPAFGALVPVVMASSGVLLPLGLAVGALVVGLTAEKLIIDKVYDSTTKNIQATQEATAFTDKYGSSVDMLKTFQDRQAAAQDAVNKLTADHKGIVDKATAASDIFKVSIKDVSDKQLAVNDALKKYGDKSPEWQKATDNLKGSNDDYNLSLHNTWQANLDLQIQQAKEAKAKEELALATKLSAQMQDIYNKGIDTTVNIIGKIGPTAAGQIGKVDDLSIHVGTLIKNASGINATIQNAVGTADQLIGITTAKLSDLQTQSTKLNTGLQSAGSSLQGGFNPQHRASGGSVQAGMPYIVGEVGRELFVPNQSGTIVPANKVGTGSQNITINITTGPLSNNVDVRSMARTISDEIGRLNRNALNGAY
ncbi:MAG TPA: phage tail tape measure protein [Patescibacteria group bacterium]|jgi:TP901 family phage tail tape measure protein|nr:phage tail tape measure protein [Patescibacteria group bacterium]